MSDTQVATNEKTVVVAAYLLAATVLTKTFLDDQSDETLQAVQRAVLAGASVILESTYGPTGGTPQVTMLIGYPNGCREAVTHIEFVSSSPPKH